MYKRNFVVNVVLPLILGFLLLIRFQSNSRKADEIGLGKGTTFYQPWVNGFPIHINDLNHTDTLYKGWESNGKKRPVLWLGNSQLHGINQFETGQKNSVEFYYDTLNKNNELITVLSFSYPNANLQEFLATILYSKNLFTDIDAILLPVFYDDMREDGLRNEILTNQVRTVLQDQLSNPYTENITSISSLKHTKVIEENSKSGDADMKALEATFQEKTETYLNNKMDTISTVWANRANSRGKLFNDLYVWRNKVFGIKANSVRKMIPGRFNTNYQAYLNILKFCKEKAMRLYVYIPPLRNDVPPPYEINEYNSFKKKVEMDALKNNAHFLNLENIVPAHYWGEKGSITGNADTEIDFMHFKSAGHKIVADTIYNTIKQ